MAGRTRQTAQNRDLSPLPFGVRSGKGAAGLRDRRVRQERGDPGAGLRDRGVHYPGGILTLRIGE